MSLGVFGLFSFMIALRTSLVEHKVIKGNGNITTVEKKINPYQNLRITKTIQVTLVPSEQVYMKVTTDENLQNAFTYGGDDGNLHLSIIDTIKAKPSNKILVELGVQSLEQLSLAGASGVFLDSVLQVDFLNVRSTGACAIHLNLEADQVNVSMDGASDLELKGNADFLDIRSTGASAIRASEMESKRVHLNLMGASEAGVHASKYLKVSGAGASAVRYKGEPEQIEKNLMGASSLSKM